MIEQDPETTQLNALMSMTNIAPVLDEVDLEKIGVDVKKYYMVDKDSRAEWEDRQDDYMELAAQVLKRKSFPWADASNVKYPLLSIASLQFAARAYQALIPNKNLVRAQIVGEDPDGEKFKKSRRIEKFMSYQLLEQMPNWEDSMDRLCLSLPILGNVFKKTYQGPKGAMSELVMPKDLVINYYAKSIDQANRKTHVLYHYPNEILEYIRRGDFVEHPYTEMMEEPTEDLTIFVDDEIQGVIAPQVDEYTPQEYLEQHTFLDLDDDGYMEPYIVTIHKNSATVVRIVPRFDQEGVELNDKGEIVKITPVEYFTNFVFVPDPNSGIYGLGLGLLLGPINEAANTLINQLIDAGTLSNLQSGFISKGVRMQHGNVPLKPGEWRFTNSVGDDLRKGIVPLPSKDPSLVLFQLLNLLLDSGQQLGSINDIMTGKSPGQNQPFSTTQEVLKQGQQVFSTIHKRMHRSLKQEYKKIYRLNKYYLPAEQYFTVLDSQGPEDEEAKIQKTDFAGDDTEVVPSSDPVHASSSEKLAKAQSLYALLQIGTINPVIATRRMLEAQDHENIAELMQMPEPQPSHEQQIEMQKMEMDKKDQEMQMFKLQHQAERDKAAATLSLAQAEALTSEAETKRIQVQIGAETEKARLALDSKKANDANMLDAAKTRATLDAQQQGNNNG